MGYGKRGRKGRRRNDDSAVKIELCTETVIEHVEQRRKEAR